MHAAGATSLHAEIVHYKYVTATAGYSWDRFAWSICSSSEMKRKKKLKNENNRRKMESYNKTGLHVTFNALLGIRILVHSAEGLHCFTV